MWHVDKIYNSITYAYVYWFQTLKVSIKWVFSDPLSQTILSKNRLRFVSDVSSFNNHIPDFKTILWQPQAKPKQISFHASFSLRPFKSTCQIDLDAPN